MFPSPLSITSSFDEVVKKNVPGNNATSIQLGYFFKDNVGSKYFFELIRAFLN